MKEFRDVLKLRTQVFGWRDAVMKVTTQEDCMGPQAGRACVCVCVREWGR